MSIKLDEALGVHPQMLDFRVERSKVLASNIANAETPGYQAKDLDFGAMVQSLNNGTQINRNYKTGYRIPYQSSADHNTVEMGAAQGRFNENAMAYQTSLTFLNMKISGLRSAIEGK